MSLKSLIILGLVSFGIHLSAALSITNLSVPRIIDISQKAKLSCSYDMNDHTLNSVKWYKDGQEFFRYSPITPPRNNWFNVKGISVVEGSAHCNQFLCNIELENLNEDSSGLYRCEVSGDAPEFKLIDKISNMIVGVLPKYKPYISGVMPSYKYGDNLVVNCTTDWSNPATKLTWYINNKTAPAENLQPENIERTRHIEGFPLYISNLQLRIRIDDPRFITKSEVLELKCSADIMDIPSLRRDNKVRTTILALSDSGHKQRLQGHNSSPNVSKGIKQLIGILCVAVLLRNWKISHYCSCFAT